MCTCARYSLHAPRHDQSSPGEPACARRDACKADGVKMYSDYAPHRTRQVIADLTAAAIVIASIVGGVAVFSAVSELARFGRQMRDAGTGFGASMTEVGARLGDVPLIGQGIRAPFDAASGAGSTLQSAGQGQEELVVRAATALGVGVAVVPILVLLLAWLVPRLRFAVRATRTRSLVRSGVDLDLLALRALSTQRMDAIAAVDPDAVSAWRRRDPVAMRRLADLELRSSGIRVG